jgi:membrane protein
MMAVTGLDSVEKSSANAFAPHSFSRIWALAKHIYSEFSDDRIPTVAGGITFFVLLAAFPALGAAVSLYGMFAHRSEIVRDVDLVSSFLPGGAVTILRAELQRLVNQKAATLNLAFAISFVVALWSASGGFKALIEGLNIAFETKEKRSFIRQTINALCFTVAAVLLLTVAVALGLRLPNLNGLPLYLRLPLEVLVWALVYLGAVSGLAAIYRFGPDLPRPRWRWFTWGNAIAAFLWLMGTQAFTWYAQNFGSYNRVYGDLGAVVGFLTWIWLSLVILLLGAEINCEIERVDALGPPTIDRN